ncbi:MAG: DUF192 domain-containing protein [Nitrospirales bacterium]|nr:DUF192 domain-containing protein [Nitrospirales bacterium]
MEVMQAHEMCACWHRSASWSFFTLLLVLILSFSLWVSSAQGLPVEPLDLHTGLATVQTSKGVTLYAEIANTPQQRRKGLMFRHSLAPDHGMLFIFQDSARWTFWMKNTKMALDIIWIDKKGKIVDIHHKAPICERVDDFCPRYTPRAKALFVLELREGMASTLELKRGATLTITLP